MSVPELTRFRWLADTFAPTPGRGPVRLPGVRGGQDESLGDLEHAVACGDIPQARRAAAVLVQAGESEAVFGLLAREAGKSSEALDLLLESLDSSGVVRRFAAASLLDKAAVDDVSQDTLISVAESIGSYDGRSALTSWVHVIVRRRVVDHLRRQRETAPLPEDLGPGARMSSIIATRATVQEVLATLPEIYRRPVTLRDIDGMPYAEIADTLGLPAGTVRSQVTRGRALVAARLEDPTGQSPAAGER